MLLPMLPIISIGIFCLRYGQNIFDYYLPNAQYSLWNDELFYYKIIEGIIEYGIPQGYFGYNESHAQIGTFGAWSPIISMFDALWGEVFGWNLYSPIIARIFFAVFSMSVYSVLCRPNIRKTSLLFLYVIGFTLYSRYLASQMAESYIFSLLVIFAGFYEKRKRKYISMALIILLTLMRPYFVLLWLLVYENESDKKYRITEIILATTSIIGYFVILKYFTAAYFSSLIKFDWLKMFFYSPMNGIINLFNKIIDAVRLINNNILISLFSGSDVGSQYLLFVLLTVIFLILCIFDKERRVEWVKWLVVNTLFWFAIVLVYDVRVGGSRHLMPFIMLEGFVIINREIRVQFINLILVVASCYLCLIKLTNPYLMTYPVHNQTLEDNIKEINQKLADTFYIDKNNKWNNTVLWILDDGAYPWQTLYGLPAGVGINICKYGYVMEKFDNLKAGYIACTLNGKVSNKCRRNNWIAVVVQEDSNICIYKRN